MNDEWVELRLPPKPSVVGIARSMTFAAARTANVPDDRLDDVKTCISEAVTNAIRAHQKRCCDDDIVVQTATTPDGFVVEVKDFGDGFDPNDQPAHEDSPHNGGFGIAVMTTLSDSCEICTEPEQQVGTTVRLTFEVSHL